MPWVIPSRDPTLAEITSRADIRGGGSIPAYLLQRPKTTGEELAEVIKGIAPQITQYMQKRKSDEIANQLLGLENSPFAGRGAEGLKYQGLYQQYQDRQPDTAMDDLQYLKLYRDTHPSEFDDYQSRSGVDRYPVQTPDGRTFMVTGNEALEHYNRRLKKNDFSDVETVSGRKWADWNQLAENDLAHIKTDPSGQNIVGEFVTGKDKEGKPVYERRSMPVDLFRKAQERQRQSQGPIQEPDLPQAAPSEIPNQPNASIQSPTEKSYPIGTKARKGDQWFVMTENGWKPAVP